MPSDDDGTIERPDASASSTQAAAGEERAESPAPSPSPPEQAPELQPGQPSQPHTDQAQHTDPQDAEKTNRADLTLGEVLAAPALNIMLDVPLEVAVEIGRVSLSLGEVVSLQPGMVVQLEKTPGEPLDLLVNGMPVARGEIVVVNDTFAFRVTEIIGHKDTARASDQQAGGGQ